MDTLGNGYAGIMARYYNQRSEVFKRQGLVDSAYQNIRKSIAYERRAQWIVDQEEVSKNAIEFTIEKEQQKAEQLRRVTRMQRTGNILMSLLALLSILFGIVFFNKRRKIAAQNLVISRRNTELKEAVHKQSLLLSEVHHRVKNNLQLIISLLTLEDEKSVGDKELSRLAELSKKVRSIALIHEQLYGEGNFERIDISDYIY